MPRPVHRAVLLVLFCLTFMGCAAAERDAARRSGLLIEPGEANKLDYRINWATDLELPQGQQIVAAKRLGDLLVVVERPTNLVSAVSLRNGELLWRRLIGSETEDLMPPARRGDTIVLNSATRLYLLRARDGEPSTVYDLDHLASTGPMIADNLAILGSTDGTTFGVNLESGVTSWRYGLSDSIIAPLVGSDDTVLTTDAGGDYAMLSSANGSLLWRGRTFGSVVAQPALGPETAFIPSRDQSLYALDRSTGRDVWTYRATEPLTVEPAAYEQVVALPLPGQGVVGLDPASGEAIWRIDTPGTRPVTKRGEAILLAAPRAILLAEPTTGRILDRARTLPLRDVIPGPDSSLILLSPQGRVLRINSTQ